MDLRQVTAKVKPLQTHILQDYLKLEILSMENPVKWKDYLVKELKQYDKKLAYQDTLKTIAIKGIDNYSVDDMDITLLSNLLKKGGELKCSSYKCRCHIENLCEDRIFDAHSNANESDMDLFVWATGALHNLKIFVESVYKNENLKEQEKVAYIKKNLKEINLLLEEIKFYYDGSLEKVFMLNEMNNIISTIMNSKNKSDMYWKMRDIISAEGNESKLEQFVLLAAERGITLACTEIADAFFYGWKKPVDYTIAAKYYEKVSSSLSVHDKLNLASIYVNHLADGHDKEEGYKLIESIKLTNLEIHEYETEEGYTFFSLRKKTE